MRLGHATACHTLLFGFCLLLVYIAACTLYSANAGAAEHKIIAQSDNGQVHIRTGDPILQKIADFLISHDVSAIDLQTVDPTMRDQISRVSLPIAELMRKLFPERSFILVYGTRDAFKDRYNTNIKKIIFLDSANPEPERRRRLSEPKLSQPEQTIEQFETGWDWQPTDRESLFLLLEDFAQGDDGEHDDLQANGQGLSVKTRGLKLTRNGIVLPTVFVDPTKASTVHTIDSLDDIVVGTHAIRHTANGSSLQLTPNGTWVSWDGRPETLIDSRMAKSSTGLVFTLSYGDVSNEFFPLNYSIAYQTPTELKFGVFQVVPRGYLSR